MKRKLIAEEKKIDKEIKGLQETEYGLKEFIHGFLLGIVFGIILTWMLLK